MFDSYWFGLVIQLAAIATAGWIVISVFGVRRRGAFALALTGVAMALLGGQYAAGVKPAVQYLQAVDDKFGIRDRPGARTWCVNEPGLPDLNFIRFVQANLPGYSRYQLFLRPGELQLNVNMCLALILMPSVETLDPARAQYVIFFGAIPEEYRDQTVETNPNWLPYAPDHGILKVEG